MSYVTFKDRGNGKRYYVVFDDPCGRRRWIKAGTRKKDADALKRRIDSEIASGTFEKHENIRFSEFADKWYADYVDLKLKETTKADYRQVIHKHLNPFFGNYLLKDISTRTVQNYVSRKARENLSPRTVNKTITILREILKHAVRWGYLGENPALYAEKLRQPKYEMLFLRPEDLRRLIEAASDKYRALFTTAAFTGARQGELLALTWADVDLEHKVINVKHSYNPLHGMSEPKTASAKRAISISDELVSVLTNHYHRTGGKPDELVFQNKSNKPINRQNLLTREFYPALHRAGLPKIRFHDLRHTYATFLISMGENIKFIQRQLGHANITTTLDTYGHLMTEAYDGFGSRFDTFVLRDIDTPEDPTNNK